jgi:hypothetical protein
LTMMRSCNGLIFIAQLSFLQLNSRSRLTSPTSINPPFFMILLNF